MRGGMTRDSMGQLDSIVQNGQKISVTCGTISTYAVGHLQSVGVQTRIVKTLTLDPGTTMTTATP